MKRDRLITGGALAVALAAGGIANGEIFLVDVGQTQNLSSGPALTASPDGNGNTWNNFTPGTFIRLVDTDGNLSGTSVPGLGIGFGATTGVGTNGSLTPGGPETPDAALGNLAVASATQDYGFTQGTMSFRLSELDSGLFYTFTLFGARATGSDRITEYTVTGGNGSQSGTLNTSTNTSGTVVLTDLTADANGVITIDVSVLSGGFGYLNAFSIETRAIPAPGAFAAVLGAGVVAARRRRK